MFSSSKLIVFIILFLPLTLISQTTGMSSKLLQALELESEMSPSFGAEAYPAANVIDPDYYYLGPGDVISFLLIPQNTKEIEIEVYPDNTIIIPKLNLGINIKGMTLSSLKEKLANEALIKNSSSKVFISLKKPKQCIITIKGNTDVPGVYTLPGNLTVASVLRIGNKFEVSNSITPVEMQQDYIEKNNARRASQRFEAYGASPDRSFWRRNVSVLHSDGNSRYLDLELGRSMDMPSQNPYIMPGDIITVPYDRSSYPSISIYGEVVRPIELPYKSGDMASYLMAFGGGLTTNASRSEIAYYSPNGVKKFVTIDADGKILNDFVIEAGSSIVVPEIKEATVDKKPLVAIKGEVRNPGYYSLEIDTGLDELIEKAGGLTDRAYIPLGFINRRSLEETNIDQRLQYLESFLNSDLTLEDTIRYNIDFMTKKPVVAVDFVKAANGQTSVDFMDGDIVVIPDNPNRVYVFGRVYNPGFVRFEKGMQLADFLEKAGGVTDVAEEDRIRIIRGNTNVWIEPGDDIEIFAGDQIYVPGPQDIPLMAEQQQGQLYIALGQALIFLTSVLYNIFAN